jgi:hypothetical protein
MRPPNAASWMALEAAVHQSRLGFAEIRGFEEAYSPVLPCQIISVGIIIGWLAPCLGRIFQEERAFRFGNFIGSISSLCALIYVFFGGVWTNWRNGVPISGWCIFLLVLVMIWTLTTCCVCCGIAILAPIALSEPTFVLDGRRYFVVEDSMLSADRRAYFKSDEFLNRAESLFRAADVTERGKLTVTEMRHIRMTSLLPMEEMEIKMDPNFFNTFDSDGDGYWSYTEFERALIWFEVNTVVV